VYSGYSDPRLLSRLVDPAEQEHLNEDEKEKLLMQRN
jgi:hypothetical protein